REFSNRLAREPAGQRRARLARGRFAATTGSRSQTVLNSNASLGGRNGAAEACREVGVGRPCYPARGVGAMPHDQRGHWLMAPLVSATWHPPRCRSSPNDIAQPPGPPATAACQEKPAWRPRSAAAPGSAGLQFLDVDPPAREFAGQLAIFPAAA